ncbi:MAG: hydroxyacylglutathione hydrolase [Gluconacetobacter diazotrophicus]|nr:hydroxyacylglutathione hydrolase [Gluconacetobacter diazotrophicus]
MAAAGGTAGGGLEVAAIPILADNYAWMLRDVATGAVGMVDPADAAAVGAFLDGNGGRLDLVLLTHHHADHIAGALEVARRFGAPIVGAGADARRLPPLDLAVAGGDEVRLGELAGRVIETPGHADGHVSYFFPGGPAVFCGDTLFSLGCGRLLEGSAEEMFASLRRLAALPDDTLVCCGHEYTESNARFALSEMPDNTRLRERADEIRRQRAAGSPTLPSRLGDEKAANPFLFARDAAELGAMRRRKDAFR